MPGLLREGGHNTRSGQGLRTASPAARSPEGAPLLAHLMPRAMPRLPGAACLFRGPIV